jgi:hypothetical protein
MPDHGGRTPRSTYLREFIERSKRDAQAERDALAVVRAFNARSSSGRAIWFWPKIAAALTAKHPWLIVLCESCGLVVDLDLRMKPRDPDASIRIALRDVQCPRCNGHGRTKIAALSEIGSR